MLRAALVGALAVGATLLPVAAAPAGASGDHHPNRILGNARQDTTPTSSAFSATKTVTRTYLDAEGKSHVVNSRTVKLRVNQTRDLFGRQDINVSWSGAQPTGGIQPYLNRTDADQQEYPMVLLECRGQDSSTVSASNRVSPQTCWTHGPDERFQSLSYTSFGPWRLDAKATADEREAVVGRPGNLPSACGSAANTEHWLPFEAVDGKKYYYGNQSCAGIPPEDYNSDQSQQIEPPNTTFAPTSTDGTGSWKFDVWTQAENASLGCSATVRCTLEVIPIMGINCDPYGKSGHVRPGDVPDPSQVARAISLCEATGNYPPGSRANASQGPALAVSGALWWSASNWDNRISVPLDFAQTSNACSQTGGGAPVDVYGSELMNEATSQWAPKFCLDPKLFKFTHVQTAEPLAQTLLNDPTSGVHAVFSASTPPATYAQPTVQAPVSVTGFSISYTIDNNKQNAVDNLVMTPRLLAKLLTESYTGEDFNRFSTGQYPYLKNNPYNITQDPEFQALNPNISAEFGNAGPATLIALSADSDVTYAVTSYINADPEARAWLDGKPDPWGMVVNKYYKKIKLPITRWPLLDTTLPNFGQDVPCTQLDPAPWLPLVASPTPTLATTSLDVQFASSPGKVACTTVGDPGPNQLVQWTSQGSQPPGQRFVIGITSLGEAQRYDLAEASLQSTGTEDGSKNVTKGRTFVQATQQTLRAAAKYLRGSDTTRTWTADPAELRKHADAYPGIMLVNADVPTKGLSRSDAVDYAKLLDFAAGDGQTPGAGYGQLPGGYLPMTKANGLGALADYTRRAADAVRAQTGDVPALTPPGSTGTGKGNNGGSHGSGSGNNSGGSNGSGGGYGGGTGDPGTGGNVAGGGSTTGGGGSTGGGSTTKGGTPTAQQQAAASVQTPGTGLGAAGVLLPVILALAALGGLLAGGATFRRRGAPAAPAPAPTPTSSPASGVTR